MNQDNLIAHRKEVVESIQDFAAEQLMLLKTVEQSWQPNDILPDMTKDDWRESISTLREGAKALPNDLLVVLVGDMVTEEALPSYQSWLNRYEGIKDSDGVSETPWAKWVRGWTAEENRHGDLLNKYLYLTGRVDMRSIEVTIQNLLRNGFNPNTDADPYKGFIYTSFQERATKISHANVGTLAKNVGEASLNRICNLIASDEARHEEAYKRFILKIAEVDPQGVIIAIEQMLRQTIHMPAQLIDDGTTQNLFDHFSVVAQRLGVYTAQDYAQIIDHLVQYWKLQTMTGLNGVAAKAQDYVCTLAERYTKLASRMERKIVASHPVQFSWIFGATA